MPDTLIDSLDKAVENVARYQTEVEREPQLAGRMRQVHAWYAVRSGSGTWHFGPSKFIGYADSTARAYLSRTAGRDGRRSEAVLKKWFGVVSPETKLGSELEAALQRFLNAHGHSRPRAHARIAS